MELELCYLIYLLFLGHQGCLYVYLHQAKQLRQIMLETNDNTLSPEDSFEDTFYIILYISHDWYGRRDSYVLSFVAITQSLCIRDIQASSARRLSYLIFFFIHLLPGTLQLCQICFSSVLF